MSDELGLQRIAVVGTCGAGKTQIAKALSNKLGIPHFELDNLHWKEDWTPVQDEVFRQSIVDICRQDRWITDGNYGKIREQLFARTQTVVWLDYSFWLTFSRLLYRTLIRAVTREKLPHGNIESWQQTFFSQRSILWWAITTFSRRRKEYEKLSGAKEYSHIQFMRFRNPMETGAWLESLDSDQASGRA